MDILVLLIVTVVVAGVGVWMIKRPTQPGNATEKPDCNHDWQRDGQTMTAIRWTCTRCGKSELR